MTLDDHMMLLESVATIVATYVANNTVPKEALPALIGDIFKSLAQLGEKTVPIEELKPAVPIKRSVQPDFIVCLEDGRSSRV